MEQRFSDALARCQTLSRRGEPDLALRLALDLKPAADEAGPDALALWSQRIAWLCFQISEIETGLDHARRAKDHWARRGASAEEASSGAIFAWLLLERGRTDDAAAEAIEALSKAERCDDPATLSFALNVLAVVFWFAKTLDRAQILSERSVAIARDLADPVTLGWWLINLGGIHSEIGYQARASGDEAGFARSIEIALAINAEAIALLEAEGDGWGLRISLANAAEYHAACGAILAAEADLQRWDEAPGHSTIRADSQYFFNKAQVLILRRRFDEALVVCERSLAAARQARNADIEAHALRFMSEIHEGLGEFQSALAYFKLFHDAQGRLSAERTQRQARITEIHYETERFKRLADAASKRADELAISALSDPLTGLGNRRRLDRAFDDLRQAERPYGIAVIDLDHFKRINDTFTHVVGDDVLRRVAATITGAIRPVDVVVRMGGEEFVVVWQDVDLAAATALSIRLNAALAAGPWSDLRPGLKVTASIGVAGSAEAAGPEAVLGLADQRVYSAKAAGRARVESGARAAAETSPPLIEMAILPAPSRGKTRRLPPREWPRLPHDPTQPAPSTLPIAQLAPPERNH